MLRPANVKCDRSVSVAIVSLHLRLSRYARAYRPTISDDIQIYISLSLMDPRTSMSTVNDCLVDTLLWMESSKFKQHVVRTDLIIIGTKQQRNKIFDYFPVKILGNDTLPSDTFRNLDVVLAVISSFISTFHKFANHVSTIIYVISVESGVIYL